VKIHLSTSFQEHDAQICSKFKCKLRTIVDLAGEKQIT